MNNPIQEGIKQVAVGLKGSKHCSSELIQKIITQLKNKEADTIQEATFLAALSFKGVHPQEEGLYDFYGKELFLNPLKMVQKILKNEPPEIQKIALQLYEKDFSQKNLSEKQAHRLGQFLFHPSYSPSSKAFIASLLRVRYTDSSEYKAFIEEAQKATPSFYKSILNTTSSPQIQISEATDGMQKSYSVTPLLAYFFEKQGFHVVQLIAPSSGPKFGINLFELSKKLNLDVLSPYSNLKKEDIGQKKNLFGFLVHQEDFIPELKKWREIRLKMLKRPFLSTIEKYWNPLQAKTLFTSAFHSTFENKAVELIESSHFQSGAVVFKSVEGSLTLALHKKTKIIATAKNNQGHWSRKEFIFTPEMFEIQKQPPPVIKPHSIDQNVKWIRHFLSDLPTEQLPDSEQKPYLFFKNQYLYTQRVWLEVWNWIQSQTHSENQA